MSFVRLRGGTSPSPLAAPRCTNSWAGADASTAVSSRALTRPRTDRQAAAVTWRACCRLEGARQHRQGGEGGDHENGLEYRAEGCQTPVRQAGHLRQAGEVGVVLHTPVGRQRH